MSRLQADRRRAAVRQTPVPSLLTNGWGGDGVVATPAPGMASTQPPQSQPKSTRDTVLLNGLQSIR